MLRILMLGAACMALGTAAFCEVNQEKSTPSKPDILLIIADDMGPHLGCYGDTVIKTPNMDRLASEGVRFDNAWVTQASCSPSRSSILTGTYPHQNGQIALAHLGFGMTSAMESIPSLLGHAGYFTGVIGKVHVKPVEPFPFDYKIEPGQFDARDARDYEKHIQKFLDQSTGKPIFLNLSYTDPHRPFETDHKGLPASPITTAAAHMLPFMKGLEQVGDLLEQVTGYYNGIMRVDACVGAALDQLKRAGRLDNTLIILIGDHGAPFGRGKVTCYNPGMRIPYIVKWPGVSKAGASSKALVSTLDILPTFLDAAGTSAPANLEGKSLRTVAANPDGKIRDYMFGEFTAHLPADYYPRRTIRDERYQLIVNLLSPEPNPTPGVEGDVERRAVKSGADIPSPVLPALKDYMAPPRYELFDLQNDPENFVNLGDKPELAETRQRLLDELVKWQTATRDPLQDPSELKRLGEDIRRTKNLKAGVAGGDEEKPGKRKRKKP